MLRGQVAVLQLEYGIRHGPVFFVVSDRDDGLAVLLEVLQDGFIQVPAEMLILRHRPFVEDVDVPVLEQGADEGEAHALEAAAHRVGRARFGGS